MPNFIDYSQYRLWSRCPWAWYWRYVKGWEKKYEGQRKDALCLGAMVHNGLENSVKTGVPKISDDVVEEFTPQPDTLSMARLLVEEYTRLYPKEDFPVHRFEEPLRFPVGPYTGLAKVDAYFRVDELTTVESGLPGYEIALQPGWWVREYKTKDAGSNRANWNQNWMVNMQANFQMLALQHHIGEPVQGVLVSVLEKPKVYVPKRKCSGCGDQIEMALFLSTGDGKHACPNCGTAQTLKPYEPKVKLVPQFYRLKAVRSPEQLQEAMSEINYIAKAMRELENGDRYIVVPTRENCVHPIYGPCEYFPLDIYGEEPESVASLRQDNPLRYVQIGI